MGSGGYRLLEVLRRSSKAGVEADPANETALPPRPTLWRRLFHVGSGSSIPILAIFTSVEVMVVLMAVLSGLAIVVETARLRLPGLNQRLVRWLSPLLKASERQAITGATYMALASLVAFLAFDKPVAITALLFVSLGDPAAALVGSRVGGPRLGGKSPVGTLAFVLVGLSTAAVLMAVDEVEHHWSIGVGAAIAALVELAPLRLDDNLTVPLISGAAMTIMLG